MYTVRVCVDEFSLSSHYLQARETQLSKHSAPLPKADKELQIFWLEISELAKSITKPT